MQRRAAGPAPESERVPDTVREVLASPGRPLDPEVRAYFEPRFGHDFGHVRIHDDTRAAESATAVSALAYTVGDHIAFGSGQFRPGSEAGRQLLAHELVHTLQQRELHGSGPLTMDKPASGLEREADRLGQLAVHARTPTPTPGAAMTPMSPTPIATSGAGLIQRTAVSHCTAGRHSAPADPAHDLEFIELLATIMLIGAALNTSGAVTIARLNGVMPSGAEFTAYQNRFGLAPAVGTRFRNRVTGARFATQREAVMSEMESLENRLTRISNQLDRNIHYFCIAGPATRMGCSVHCSGRSASACAGIRAVFLCPSFWGFSSQQQATLLIHELAHMALGVLHTRNFGHASCYANYVADLANAPTTTPACTP